MDKAMDAADWAASMFAHAELGDRRRARRLVKVASLLASADGASTAKATADDAAAREGAYRLLRNQRVEPEQIAEAGFTKTIERAREVATVLAVEDTSTLSYKHSVADELGDLGGPAKSFSRGFMVHSVLLIDFASGATLGLAEQRYWMRSTQARGQRRLQQRDYHDKESFKWQAASQALLARLGPERMRHVVSVCDREADIYEYLCRKVAHEQRFVVRASRNRVLDGDDGLKLLWPKLASAPVTARAAVHVPQRAGRVARIASVSVRRACVSVKRPSNVRAAAAPKRVTVNAVLVREDNPPTGVEPLEWMLLTSEPIARASDVGAVMRMYRLRWRIEEFHKLWKSGVGVERCRMQSADNILRLAVILAFVATRVLQLRELFDSDKSGSCAQLLTPIEWTILWVTVEKKPPPDVAPTVEWAYHALGRLGGWYDSKRTGRVGPKTLLDGWNRLEQHIAGYEAARLLQRHAAKKK